MGCAESTSNPGNIERQRAHRLQTRRSSGRLSVAEREALEQKRVEEEDEVLRARAGGVRQRKILSEEGCHPMTDSKSKVMNSGRSSNAVDFLPTSSLLSIDEEASQSGTGRGSRNPSGSGRVSQRQPQSSPHNQLQVLGTNTSTQILGAGSSTSSLVSQNRRESMQNSISSYGQRTMSPSSYQNVFGIDIASSGRSGGTGGANSLSTRPRSLSGLDGSAPGLSSNTSALQAVSSGSYSGGRSGSNGGTSRTGTLGSPRRSTRTTTTPTTMTHLQSQNNNSNFTFDALHQLDETSEFDDPYADFAEVAGSGDNTSRPNPMILAMRLRTEGSGVMSNPHQVGWMGAAVTGGSGNSGSSTVVSRSGSTASLNSRGISRGSRPASSSLPTSHRNSILNTPASASGRLVRFDDVNYDEEDDHQEDECVGSSSASVSSPLAEAPSAGGDSGLLTPEDAGGVGNIGSHSVGGGPGGVSAFSFEKTSQGSGGSNKVQQHNSLASLTSPTSLPPEGNPLSTPG